jgi:hypothetical protein
MELHIITHIIERCPLCGGKMRVRRTKTDLLLNRITRWAYCAKPCTGRGKSVMELPKEENKIVFYE